MARDRDGRSGRTVIERGRRRIRRTGRRASGGGRPSRRRRQDRWRLRRRRQDRCCLRRRRPLRCRYRGGRRGGRRRRARRCRNVGRKVGEELTGRGHEQIRRAGVEGCVAGSEIGNRIPASDTEATLLQCRRVDVAEQQALVGVEPNDRDGLGNDRCVRTRCGALARGKAEQQDTHDARASAPHVTVVGHGLLDPWDCGSQTPPANVSIINRTSSAKGYRMGHVQPVATYSATFAFTSSGSPLAVIIWTMSSGTIALAATT